MRKLTADYLFTLERPPVKEGVVIIDDRGRVLDVLESRENAGDLEVFDGILCPGMINSHGHLELSHLKDKLPRHTGLVDFIIGVQAFRNTDNELVQQAISEAEHGLYAQGIVGMGDICNTADTFDLKSRGRIRYHTFLECFGFTPQNAGLVLERAQVLKEKVSGQSSINPHAPYSVSEPLFKSITEAEPGLLSIHNQECRAENEFYQSASGDFERLYKTFGIDISAFQPFGRNSLPVYAAWLGRQKKLLVHNTFTVAADLSSLSSEDHFTFCLCPGANLFIENRLPDIPMLVRSGWPLVIGTDSLASNDQLNLVHEMYLIQHAFPEITLGTLLGWASRNAAAFFGWDDLGSMSAGKSPGIVQITGLAPNLKLGPDSRSKRIA